MPRTVGPTSDDAHKPSQVRNHSENIRSLIAGLKDPDRDVSTRALVALAEIGGPAAPELRAVLTDPNPNVRMLAKRALDFIDGPAAAGIPGLIAALESITDDCSLAIEVLVNIGGPAVPALTAAAMGPGLCTPINAAAALGRIGAHQNSVLAGLIAASKDPNRWTRHRAVIALGEMGRPTEPVIDALTAALKDESKFVRWAAARSLTFLGSHFAQVTKNPALLVIPGLKTALNDQEEEVRRSAVEGLTAIIAEAVEILSIIAPDLLKPNSLALEKEAAISVFLCLLSRDNQNPNSPKDVEDWARFVNQQIANTSRRMTARPSHPFNLLHQDRLLEFYLLASVYRQGLADSFRAAEDVLRPSFCRNFVQERGWDYRILKRVSTKEGTHRRRLKEWNEAFSHVLSRPIEVFVLHTPPWSGHGPKPVSVRRLTDDGHTVLRQLEEFLRANPPK